MSGKYDDDDDIDEEKNEETKQESKGSKEKQSSPSRISENQLLEKVQSYFYEDPSFSQAFENFVKIRSVVIDPDSEEYKLEYTTVYEDYKRLFEDMMEGYIKSLGSTVMEFYQALKSKIDKDENSSFAIFGLILSSVTDFDIFMQMMREAAYANSTRK
eukprot:gene8131-16696_t